MSQICMMVHTKALAVDSFLELASPFVRQLKYCTYKQRYTYGVLQTIQMNLILLCVWAEPAGLGSNKTALKFKYEI